MRKQFHIYTLLLFFVSVILITDTPVLAQMDGGSTTPQPPMAEKKPKETKIHGDTLVDDYFWLREKSNPAVLEHLKAELNGGREFPETNRKIRTGRPPGT